MTNFKITNVSTLPNQSEKGAIYVLDNGDLFLGKSDTTFLQLGKDYVDKSLEELESTLTANQRKITLSENQDTIPIDLITYLPDTHIEFLFDNSTKIPKEDYEIVTSTSSLSGYEIALHSPIINPEARTFELVLLHGKALVVQGEGKNDELRFHDGSTPPTNTSLIWNKTT